ncbi:MAG: ornithine cyclodeaminase family protein [Mariniblastus sp.]|nr:ornithine cyclodeaminase family protein [Mariniblastus sp.]
MKIDVISAETVQNSISMTRAIELMRDAYLALTRKEVDVPLRTTLVNENGTVLYKPAYSDSEKIFCAKIVSVFPGNASQGLAVCPGVIIVNSAETGMPVAMVEAGYLTALRTGAGTGVATDLLSARDAKIAALFGTGGQARHQLEAMLAVRDLETVFVFSKKSENARRFCEENRDLVGNCQLVADPDRAELKRCEVITTATTSPTAVFSDEEISANCHINAIGALGKDRTELSHQTLLGSRIFVDERKACLAEAGEICLMRKAGLLPEDFRVKEIGELLASGHTPPVSKTERTIFISVGNAIQDLVCVAELLRTSKPTQTFQI